MRDFFLLKVLTEREKVYFCPRFDEIIEVKNVGTAFAGIEIFHTFAVPLEKSQDQNWRVLRNRAA